MWTLVIGLIATVLLLGRESDGETVQDRLRKRYQDMPTLAYSEEMEQYIVDVLRSAKEDSEVRIAVLSEANETLRELLPDVKTIDEFTSGDITWALRNVEYDMPHYNERGHILIDILLGNRGYVSLDVRLHGYSKLYDCEHFGSAGQFDILALPDLVVRNRLLPDGGRLYYEVWRIENRNPKTEEYDQIEYQVYWPNAVDTVELTFDKHAKRISVEEMRQEILNSENAEKERARKIHDAGAAFSEREMTNIG